MNDMKTALEVVMYYKEMEKVVPGSSMLREVRQQYADMANGGDGGALGYTPSDYKGAASEYGPTCRDYNYSKYPDTFFQEVCALMGWRW
tara:strand:- start:18285 stop:18551 length:267 start_codon:yes stop_codon:yes gene_type:complete